MITIETVRRLAAQCDVEPAVDGFFCFDRNKLLTFARAVEAESADLLEQQALSLGTERAWTEKLEADLAAAQKEIVSLKTEIDTLDEWVSKQKKEIEELKKERVDLYEMALGQAKNIAAAQAREKVLREHIRTLTFPVQPPNIGWIHPSAEHIRAARIALAQPTDTSALDEAIRKAKIDVLRELQELDKSHIDALLARWIEEMEAGK